MAPLIIRDLPETLLWIGRGKMPPRWSGILPHPGLIFQRPAWPGGWNAEFKLRAHLNTIVTGKVVDGNIPDLHVFPTERRDDFTIWQARSVLESLLFGMSGIGGIFPLFLQLFNPYTLVHCVSVIPP